MVRMPSSPRIGAQCLEAFDQQRHGRVRELGLVRDVARETGGWQQHVRHGAGFCLRIVQHDRDAGAESQRDQHPVAALGGPIGDLDDDLLHGAAGFV